ncbi:hypothetical protein B0H65DRAFT_163980 [Neurospora tetraspora]|uniref:Uncharacterized protein n=1 Tax=Neurospora tetraspora TaxID=94610 RepID=A0AAE0JHN1_9PEZI|nr:hypothetical protein B0H65DRAFT_163980 [Neurospora tetraspora]
MNKQHDSPLPLIRHRPSATSRETQRALPLSKTWSSQTSKPSSVSRSVRNRPSNNSVGPSQSFTGTDRDAYTKGYPPPPPKRCRMLTPVCTTVGVGICSKYPGILRLARSRLVWNPPTILGYSTEWLYRMVAMVLSPVSRLPSPVSRLPSPVFLLRLYLIQHTRLATPTPYLDLRTFSPSFPLRYSHLLTAGSLFLYPVQFILKFPYLTSDFVLFSSSHLISLFPPSSTAS